ncbi:MAG: DUF2892 domain-containing protein [Flavobacteriaceae bacterium]|tara:strand:- start:566 stop:772 length:207 start_codon:yes stop_codon:yes gene_type:complete
MKILFKNQNKNERIARFIISIFLIPSPIFYGLDYFSISQSIVGGVLLFNAVSGMCVIYRIFKVNTCEI